METTHTTTRPSNTTGDALGNRNQRLAILILVGRRCPICKCKMHFGGSNRRTAMTIDHMVAWSTGGSNHAGNLIPLCGSCNSSKCDTDLTAWLPGHLINIGRASTLVGARRMLKREITKLNKIAAAYAAILEV